MDGDITRWLHALKQGDEQAHEKLFTQVYAELKVLARSQLRMHASPTLNTTGLVHDLYIKLATPQALELDSRKHFFALAAKAMRQIVIDHARALATDKRHAQSAALPFDEVGEISATEIAPDKLLQLDRALTQLATEHPRFCTLIELRFFAGLELEQIAEMQQVSQRTLNRDWRRARAELYAALYD